MVEEVAENLERDQRRGRFPGLPVGHRRPLGILIVELQQPRSGKATPAGRILRAKNSGGGGGGGGGEDGSKRRRDRPERGRR